MAFIMKRPQAIVTFVKRDERDGRAGRRPIGGQRLDDDVVRRTRRQRV